MQLLDETWVYSPSDMIAAAECEFGFVARAIEGRPVPEDALMARASELGNAHEDRLKHRFIDRFGSWQDGSAGGLVDTQDRYLPGRPASRADLLRAQAATVAAARAGADVIAQAVLFDGRMMGYADFLLRQADGSYVVADAKLARSAKVRALVQIGAYRLLALAAGVAVADRGSLILGDGTVTTHDLTAVEPVVLQQRRALEELLASRSRAPSPLEWRDDSLIACGRCAICQEEAAAHRDVLVVAGMRMQQRARLSDAGIVRIDELAEHKGSVAGIPGTTMKALRAQARLQVRQLDRAQHEPGATGAPLVDYEVFATDPLGALPPPSPGDIYFDFEGDPLWQDRHGTYGLEYLFGLAEAPLDGDDPVFRSFVAHDRASEKQALTDFLRYVAQRRAQWPSMHVYHYADYERAALLRLASTHNVGEDEIDDLLRHNVLVDLYPVVRRSVRISQPSYSLKMLEPLYMGEDLRTGEVTTAGDSVIAYAAFCQARDSGETSLSSELWAEIIDYNAYDCRSTLGLHRWLLERAAQYGVAPTGGHVELDQEASESAASEASLVEPLLAWADAGEPAERTPEQRAVALVAAAVGFHRRESKPFWWAHYHRLSAPLDDIADRDSMLVTSAEVATDWHKPPRKRNERRLLRLYGDMPTGSRLERDHTVTLVYDDPHPEGMKDGGPGTRGWKEAQEVAVAFSDVEDRDVVAVTELLAKGVDRYSDLPVLLAPAQGPVPRSAHEALVEIATRLSSELPAPESDSAVDALPSPAADLLLRRPPRLRTGSSLPDSNGDFVGAVLAAVLDLEGSTLAVQGPPGAGKTYVGSRVIAALVQEHGWRVGVVAQSHAVVNHLLDTVVGAGLPGDLVGKKGRPATSRWTDLDPSRYRAFIESHAESGCVVGGTEWDFTNTGRVGRRELDLLVIDEAGQYSLAATLAVSVAAQRLLLMGDPQQLPQVSQGVHPEPVNESALGWLSEAHTLDPTLGYFLDRSWRMHPALARRISEHSYEGRLQSQESVTAARALRDQRGSLVQAGVFSREVHHMDNAVESHEEADEVTRLVGEALTWTWQASSEAVPRPMKASDILVVAPYNAQIALIARTLRASGHEGVRVGTVDKFQGQEAPLTLVSMTASAPKDVPRGMAFLLSPNRINVAVSRAQWRTVVVRSAALTDYLPSSPETLADLGRFLRLVGNG